ncbi:hypothetical protein V1514DRAFT_339114 [Lipomyces japonicus]|uniref:uncharacterized protein n=1 Tax=Lipomyces japonicus TaxID=56871 RepID=UPI0034CF1975
MSLKGSVPVTVSQNDSSLLIAQSASDAQQPTQVQSTRPHPTRTPSNTYAPARRPALLSEGSRKGRSSSHTRERSRKHASAQHNTKDGPQQQLQSHSQQQIFSSRTEEYMSHRKLYQKMVRDETGEEYYKGLDFSSDEDDSPSIEYPTRSDFQADIFDADVLGAPSLIVSKGLPSVDELENPKNRERLEWQAMLSSVLTGEVVKSEKRKFQTTSNSFSGIKTMERSELWMQIRAKVCGRPLEAHRKIVENGRHEVDKVLKDILHFQIQGKDITSMSPDNQIKAILRIYEKCESLWRCTASMQSDKPIIVSPEFKVRYEALISWVTVSDSVHNHIEGLRRWIGNDELDLTRVPEGTIGEAVPFVESIFKSQDIGKVFENKILTTLGPLIEKAKHTTIQQGQYFAVMHLPSYLEELLILLNFPTRLVQEIIRARVRFARGAPISEKVIDEVLNTFKTIIQLAIRIRRDYYHLSAPELGWELPIVIDENFDSVFMDGLKFYFELLDRKFLGRDSDNDRHKVFVEAEDLESELKFSMEVARNMDSVDVKVANYFSHVEAKIIERLHLHFERQMKGPLLKTAPELEKWYNPMIDHIQGYQRRLQRFARILFSYFENACEYSISSANQPSLINALINSGHYLINATPNKRMDPENIFIIADPYTASRADIIRTLLGACTRDELAEADPHERKSYVLMICTRERLDWDGPVITLELPAIHTGLKPGRFRLITDGANTHLVSARNTFAKAVGEQYQLVVEQRSNFSEVDRELLRVRKCFYKLALFVITGADAVRRQCKGIGCQDMINHYFVFAQEVGQRAMRYLDLSRRASCALKLVHLSIDWVSFVCDDCVASDKKTFQWSVNALEFAMMMIRGVNILAVNDEEFSRLRLKVAGCMTLLISHFDIMGARSSLAAALELKKQEKSMNQLQDIEKDDEISMEIVRKERSIDLVAIEEGRRLRQEELHSVGKVLDDSNVETQYLMFLNSTLSRVTIRWQQGRFIGGGTFGSVYAAINLDTGDVMAVKEIRLQDTQSIRHIVKSIKDEMTVLEMLDHPNIVQYYGVEVHREKVFIFMEYCQGGSLASLLEHGRIEDETVSQVYTMQMLDGLAYLHKNGIVHRDIKPENILLDHLGVIKFVDFGAAKVIAQKGGKTRAGGATVRTNLNSMTGTPMYMSPEVITGNGTGRQGSIDIWSLGCCVLEMATGRRPWANLDNEWAIMYHIAAGHLPSLPMDDQMSELGRNFLVRCFERDPFIRATADELLQDPWITSIPMEPVGVPAQTPSTESDFSEL